MTNASLSHQLELNQQPLVNVFEAVIGNLKQLAVNARDLHTFLQVGKVFAAWIQERIGKYEFIENEDFILTVSKTGKRSNVTQKDYTITLDMAKELSMVENNVKGREARRYFITMEKKVLGYSNQQPVLASPKLTSEQVKQLNNKIHNIKHCFHQNESANQNIMNRLRVDLSLRQMSDFRECHFNQAMQILDGLNNVAKAYSEWQYELNRMVVDWIIRDGRPWTPDVVKKLRAELDVTINHHPDWNKLAALVHR